MTWTKSYKEVVKKIITDTDLIKNFANNHFKINEEEVLELSWSSWIGEVIKSANQSTKPKTKFNAIKEFIEFL